LHKTDFAEFIPKEISGKRRLFERLRAFGRGKHVQNAEYIFHCLQTAIHCEGKALEETIGKLARLENSK
jgi:hypothetical protein